MRIKRLPETPSCAWALAAAALLLQGCVRPDARVPPGESYPYDSAEALVFVATETGLVPLPQGGALEGPAPSPGLGALSPNASILSSDGSRILVAVNRAGLATIQPSADGRAYKVVSQPRSPEFAARTVGGAWPRPGGFLVQLYRDPFAAEPPIGSLLLSIDGAGGMARLPIPSAGLGLELFALFPTGKDSWLAQYRDDSVERVVLAYLRIRDLDGEEARAEEIGKAAFEAALAPRPLVAADGELGAVLAGALRDCVAALGGEPAFLRLRGPEGGDIWYSTGPEPARQLFAWILSKGRVLVLDETGRARAGGAGEEPRAVDFAPPHPGAVFTALAAAGPLAVAAWEYGEFPELRAAGIVVAPLP